MIKHDQALFFWEGLHMSPSDGTISLSQYGPFQGLASLLVTTEAPLGKALAAMDHAGPFPEAPETP